MCGLHFAACAAVCQAAEAPEWIWLPGEPQGNQTVYFRKTFQIDGKVGSAVLTATCDNAMTVFVNGKPVLEHDDWNVPVRADVTDQLKQGDNVIAVQGTNEGSIAALLARLSVEQEDGKSLTVVTDTSWKVSARRTRGWRRAEFADGDWDGARSFGRLGVAPWGMLALDDARPPEVLATTPDAITAPDGFQVELLYSVPKNTQGSWVSMTPDPQGRLIVSDQYGGLYRVTPGDSADATEVEKLDLPIGDAQGLLWAFDSLYVMVNGDAASGSGFYRVRDTDGDGELDDVRLLKKINGGGEHGPHAIRLGPDGHLYVIAGNHTKIPDPITADSPHRNWAEDLLLPRNPDGGGHATGIMAPGGWIARTDADGRTWELFCAGFRNAYDFAFNGDGEMFAYDADMEWDTGAPWYRPTRVNHATSAAEFGWRYGTGKWPDYFPDSLGAVVDIGLGSPTGVEFGAGARFPAKYQRAFYICDWTYGKLYAVHMKPGGASYTADFEVFVAGRPLPLTDVVINHDGAMYFTIGGRRTQSGLYRVRYVGPEDTTPVGPIEDAEAAEARALRRKLESLHGRRDASAVETAWPHLNHADRTIRYAARVAVERQDLSLWKDRALAETRTTAIIQAMLALARCGDETLRGPVLERLNQLPLVRMTEQQLLAALRAYGLAFIRLGRPTATERTQVISQLNPLFPGESEFANRELCRVLVYLEAPGVVDRAIELLRAAQTQQEQMFYAFLLRNVRHGWTDDQRQAYFSWLQLAENKYRGGNSFVRFLQQIRQDAVDKLTDEERTALADVIEGDRTVEVVELVTTRQFVHNWQMSDLLPLLGSAENGRSLDGGRDAYRAAQCDKCHRFQGEGGATGPDLTGVGNRFSARDLLESILEPSKVISDQYRNTVIATVDGELIGGRVIDEDDRQVRVRTHPYARELTNVEKTAIESREFSSLSEMPVGLINVLTTEEVLDLIAYVRSGGNAADKVFGASQ